MTGRLEAIYLCASAGEAMVAHPVATAVAGEGLQGDRYATGRGRYSAGGGLGRELTLVAAEALEAASTDLGEDIPPSQTRRNLVTAGIDLDTLVGQRFRIGDQVVCVGIRDCPPCAYLDSVTGRGLRAVLGGRGGLRADVLTGGTLRVGDPIVPLARAAQSTDSARAADTGL